MSNAGQEPQLEVPDPARATDVQAQGETRLAQSLRGFGPAGILAIVVVLAGNLLFIPLSAVLALVWAYWSRTPWQEIGYLKPKNWIATAAIGVAFGGGLKLLMKAVIMPLFGAPEINQAFHYLAGNRAAIPSTLWLLIAVIGLGLRTLYRNLCFGCCARARSSLVVRHGCIRLLS